MTEHAFLELRGVSRFYGAQPSQVVALDDIDFQVERGEIVAIMGPSGSGKSTLLTIAGGLELASSGSVELDGQDLSTLGAAELARLRRRRIGYVFQEFNLLSGLTAAENVSTPLELDGLSAKKARRAALERLGQVGLADRSEAFPDDLSGGERQRVAIARALIGERQLLLADEPTGALDSTTGDEVMELIRSARNSESAVVIVTHNASVASRADRIVHLRDGRVVAGSAIDVTAVGRP